MWVSKRRVANSRVKRAGVGGGVPWLGGEIEDAAVGPDVGCSGRRVVGPTSVGPAAVDPGTVGPGSAGPATVIRSVGAGGFALGPSALASGDS